MRVDADLDRAVTAVGAALTALRVAPRSPTVRAALLQARDAVAVLRSDLTAVVLRRLVAAITDCHHDGVAHSIPLAARTRSASVALRLDPRWVAGADEHPHVAMGRSSDRRRRVGVG